MKTPIKKKWALILVVLLVFLPVNASTLSDKKDEFNNATQSIKDKKLQADQKKEQKEAVQEEIKKVDLQIVEIQDNIKELGEQLEIKKEEIADSEEKLNQAIIKKDMQYGATKARMIKMYKNQKVSYLQVIFSSSSFWEAINRVEYMRRISQKDHSILDEYKAQIASIEEQKKNIEAEEEELDRLQKSEIAKNEELEAVRGKKEEAMNRLAKEEGKLQSEIESLEEISEDLKDQINKLTKELEEKARAEAEARAKAQKSSSSSGGSGRIPTQYVGGTFMWPVPGFYRISSDYEGRTSPISGRAEFHTGIDIPANYSESVVAAADGIVITSGWVNGYGNTIMISHGSGIVTLYGHNSSLVVSNGQSVTKGQVIARIGSTGYSTGNHCHFEVRVNGDHTSPWPYLNN